VCAAPGTRQAVNTETARIAGISTIEGVFQERNTHQKTIDEALDVLVAQALFLVAETARPGL
jgi:hypothetical protein